MLIQYIIPSVTLLLAKLPINFHESIPKNRPFLKLNPHELFKVYPPAIKCRKGFYHPFEPSVSSVFSATCDDTRESTSNYIIGYIYIYIYVCI